MKDAVKVIIFDADGRLLVLRRTDTHPTLPLHPDLPGGFVDPGESLIEAAIREVKEETGFELPLESIRHERTDYTPWGAARTLYSAHLTESMPSVSISWEHDQHDWLPVHEFMKLAKPANPDYFLDITRQYLTSTHSHTSD